MTIQNSTMHDDAGRISPDMKIGSKTKPMNSGGSSVADVDAVRNRDEEHASKRQWAASRQADKMNQKKKARDVFPEEERKEREE